MKAEWNVKVVNGKVHGTGIIAVEGIPHPEFINLVNKIDTVIANQTSGGQEPSVSITPRKKQGGKRDPWTDPEEEILRKAPDIETACEEYEKAFPGKRNHSGISQHWRILCPRTIISTPLRANTPLKSALEKESEKKPELKISTPPPQLEKKTVLVPMIGGTVEIIKGFYRGSKGIISKIESGKALIDLSKGVTTWCLMKDEFFVISLPPDSNIKRSQEPITVDCKVRLIKNKVRGVGTVKEVRADTVRVEFGENNISWIEKKELEVVVFT